jgi:hypothetical protein
MFANVVPLMCVYLMFALLEANRARGVWLLVGPSLFGDTPIMKNQMLLADMENKR